MTSIIPCKHKEQKPLLSRFYWVQVLYLQETSDSSRKSIKGLISNDSHIFITHLIFSFNPLVKFQKQARAH